MSRQRWPIFAGAAVIIGAVFAGHAYFTVAELEQAVERESQKASPMQAAAPVNVESSEREEKSEQNPEAMPIKQVAEAIGSRQAPAPETATGQEIPPEESIIDESSDVSSTYNGEVPKLFAERRENVATFITRDDLPYELQQRLDEALENNRINGYLNTSEVYIEHMNALVAEIAPIDESDHRLMFKLENIDNTPLAELKYIGAIPDTIPGQENMPIPGIRRVFEYNAGYVSFYEADLRSSDALLQKEFVNQSVKDYPATQITYCAPSNRCVTQLVWLTENKRYELSLSGDIKQFGEDNLVAIASTLDLPDAKTPTENQQN